MVTKKKSKPRSKKKTTKVTKSAPKTRLKKTKSTEDKEVKKRVRGRPKKAIVEPTKVEVKTPVTTTVVIEEPPIVTVEERVTFPTITPAEIKKVELPKIKINEFTTVREIAAKLQVATSEIIKKLLSLGIVATINQRLDIDTANLIAHEFGYEAEFVPIYQDEIELKEDLTLLKTRAPVVTVMGHVDHGKTTLLDTIRQTKVVEKEHGGITQHIGAYKVKTQHGEIVFLDTPGHETFTAMRAHGAKITDIVVLVVAADDGVMPQTIEAINHARAANVPIIVAINKIDLPDSNPEGTKQQLAQYNLIPDSWGGDTLTVEISARNNINIDRLLEAIIFKAELMELKANPDRAAKGVIIESQLNPRKGPIATVLVQTGTLKIGDAFVSGLTYGKVRAMIDDSGRNIVSAGPSTPVEVLGFSNVPDVGEKFIVVQNEQFAKEIVERRQEMLYREKKVSPRRISLEDLSSGKVKQLNIIIKTDVLGSLNAVRDSIERLSLEEVKLNILHAGVGIINESDVNLALTSDAVIVGFNIRPDVKAETLAKREGVDIRTYRVIYELIDDLEKALKGMLEPKTREVVIGRAEIKKIFTISNVGTVAGCVVTDGKVSRTAKIRLLRDGVIVHDGKVASLKRFKEDVKEVEKGYECGILIENYNDIKVKDVLEFYRYEIVKE